MNLNILHCSFPQGKPIGLALLCAFLAVFSQPLTAQTAPFSASNANLKLWIDATTFSTTNGGSLSGIISDASSFSRALTTNATYETGAMNGKAVVRYTNNMTSVNSPFVSTANTYIFTSVERLGHSNWANIFSHAPHDNGLQLEQNGLKGADIYHWQTANDNNNVEQTLALNTPYILACKLENGNQRSFTVYQKNASGVLQSLGTVSNSSFNAVLSSSYIRIGSSNGSGEFANMRMGEFIYFQDALPVTETSIVEYLATKWLGTSPVLPIELLTFSGKHTEGGNLLTWQTASENNSSHFEIERSQDELSFHKIGETKAQGKATTYQFMDDAPLSMSYYRIKEVGLDKTEMLSKVVTIAANGKNKWTIYPSVTADFLTVEGVEGVDFDIINILGQSVLRGKVKSQIDVSQLVKGSYWFKTSNEVIQFVKQ